MKSFSLWRNGQLVGHFDEKLPTTSKGNPVGSMGILRPVAVPADVQDGVSQWHFTTFRKVVFETANELNLIPPPPSPPHPPGVRRVEMSSPILETDSNEPPGIPAERVFEVRDADGVPVPITTFDLHAYEMADQVPPVSWFAECGDPAARKVWVVHFAKFPDV